MVVTCTAMHASALSTLYGDSISSLGLDLDSWKQRYLSSTVMMCLYEWRLARGNLFVCMFLPPLAVFDSSMAVIISPLIGSAGQKNRVSLRTYQYKFVV